MSQDSFEARHNGISGKDLDPMLEKIGVGSLDELMEKTIPPSIRLDKPMDLPDGISEFEYINRIRDIAARNKVFRSFIGMGYYGTILPAVIQRNILENPGWYTSYTPYQAEISQGRLEALLNYQTVVTDLTGMDIANASLLDEATAAAEAMIMLYNARTRESVKQGLNHFFVDKNLFPQTLEVLKTRSEALGIKLIVGDFREFTFDIRIFGALIQYPAGNGEIPDYGSFVKEAHEKETRIAVVADILSLTLLTPPGEWGADVVVGSTQRFGIPMGYGGPNAAYFATREELKRNIPGRIIGVSVDSHGNPALRMALQTREQHIKRERATSNICTAQALLAIMAGMYAIYHGPEGLRRIAGHIHRMAGLLSEKLTGLGYKQLNNNFFDTLAIELPGTLMSPVIREIAERNELNFRYLDERTVGISLDETVLTKDINDILEVFAKAVNADFLPVDEIPERCYFNSSLKRTTPFLTLRIFNRYHSETEMMRYIKKLERKDFSLTHSMISLGSCTMKLNAAVEMLPLSWPEFGNLHPFVPSEQAEGYSQLFRELEEDLKTITGFAAVSFQPNSGAAGEYAGLLVIRDYQKSIGEGHRNVVLIPASAHGTNPASAVMAGSRVVVVECDEKGNVDIASLEEKVSLNRDNLSAFMITYPSTHGVFEEKVVEMIRIIHESGGQVYMDGANMNAQVGLTNPAVIGADVCHLNLHKTFAIPHGGGGPGMGPIAVAEHLKDFLPRHPVIETGGKRSNITVGAAPWGSASILTISHGYIKMMGGNGLTEASRIAILNANYIAAALKGFFEVLYTGTNGFVAHEMILECRNFRQLADITEADIAKRLMDYGFHAPTLSFPVHGTLMVEPTESESLAELNRFIEAMISIYGEIMEISEGKSDSLDNVLKNAPHTAEAVTNDTWKHTYTRGKAAYPLKWISDNKFWPAVGRLDDAYGDRNLICSCAALDEYHES
ncbi:MAG: aminomethyl-transferring glycine dehydrogenase [Bacteroidales bacterium]|nr:MAG: aminomethyl-transferring glycine dehydrogenase [Bacteroidales bacterium]